MSNNYKYKRVDGKLIELTPEEIEAKLIKDAERAQLKKQYKKVKSPNRIILEQFKYFEEQGLKLTHDMKELIKNLK